MKTAFILFFILVLMALKADAAAPYGIKGQGQAGTLYSNVHQFPNNQVTNLGGINALVETGNDDILSNGSFEHSTYDTGWTNTDGTLTEETGASNIKSGLKSAKLVTSADNVEFYQDSTLYASSSVGVAGTISGWISNTAPNVYFCQRIAGAWVKNTDGSQITNCRLVNQTGVFTEYSMPVIFGATSNGAGFVSLTPSIAATVTTTGTTYFDKFKVVAGQSFTATANDTDWASCGHTTSDFTGFGTVTAIETQCKRDGGDLLMKGNFTSGTSTAVEARVNLKLNGVTLTSKGVSVIPTIQAASAMGPVNVNSTTQSLALIEPSVTYITFGAQSVAANGLAKLLGSGFLSSTQKFSIPVARIPINGWDVSSSATAQAADSFDIRANPLTWANAATYTLATLPAAPVGTYITYAVTVSTLDTRVQCATTSRPTQTDLDMKTNGFFLTSRAYATAGTCALPTIMAIQIGKNLDFLQLGVYKTTGLTGVMGEIDYALYSSNALSSGLYSKVYDRSTGILILSAGSLLTTATTTNQILYSDGSGQINGYYSIAAQKKKDFMVGDISGLEKCATTLECTDTFVADVSITGVVTDENYDFINGNCAVTATNQYTCTYNTGLGFTRPLICNPTVKTNVTTISDGNIQASTTALVTYQTYRNDTSVAIAQPATLTCHRAGADYIGKTAKAVASDQNDRTPGVVGEKTCKMAFGGAAATLISPVECSTGTCIEVEDNCGTASPPSYTSAGYYLNATWAAGTWANSTLLDCHCKSYTTGVGGSRECELILETGDQTWASSATGGYVGNSYSTNQAGAANNAYQVITCKGKAP
jgi:hypothetical protein